MPNLTGKSGGGPFKMKIYGQGKNPIQMNSPLKQDKKNKDKEPQYSTTSEGDIMARDPEQKGTAFEWYFTEHHTDKDSIVTNPDGSQKIVSKKSDKAKSTPSVGKHKPE